MKLWLSLAGCFLLFPASLLAQLSEISPAAQPRMNPNQTKAMLIGKVAMENGAASTDSATIVLECAGQTRAHTYSDREGSFSLSIDIVSDIPVTAHFQRETGVVSDQEWANCELYADLSGYSSERVHSFGSRDRAIVEVGTMVLHRLAQDQAIVSRSALRLLPLQTKRGRHSTRAENRNKRASGLPPATTLSERSPNILDTH